MAVNVEPGSLTPEQMEVLRGFTRAAARSYRASRSR